MSAGAARIALVDGTAVPLRGDDIDTDRIIPARYLRTITFEGLGEHVFEDDRRAAGQEGAAPHPFDDQRFAGARVLLVHSNFGCGSSREHAPQALYGWGIRTVVAESFSDIFFGNACVMGLPCVTASRANLDALMTEIERHPRTVARVNLTELRCEWDGGAFPIQMPGPVRDSFVTGVWDTTGLLLEDFDQVRAVAGRLPYVTGSFPPRG